MVLLFLSSRLDFKCRDSVLVQEFQISINLIVMLVRGYVVHVCWLSNYVALIRVGTKTLFGTGVISNLKHFGQHSDVTK